MNYLFVVEFERICDEIYSSMHIALKQSPSPEALLRCISEIIIGSFFLILHKKHVTTHKNHITRIARQF